MSDSFDRWMNTGRSAIERTGRALAVIPQRSRALANRLPPPVQVELRRLSRRSARVGRELMAGLFVIGLIAVVAAYGRLNSGPISLPGLVPLIEESINRELSGLEVDIEGAIIQRASEGAGVEFRLTKIRLMEPDGTIVAQSPLAAVGLSGSALLSGRIAPGSVDFIGPRLLLFYDDDAGLSLTFSRPAGMDGDRGGSVSGAAETIITKGGNGAQPAATVDVTKAITDAFERARAGDGTGSYLARFGVENAVVVFEQDGVQTVWQVPDFTIGLEHGRRRSILVGDAEVGSSEGPWKLEFRTEQSGRHDRLSVHAAVRDLVPNIIAANIPGARILKALDMPVTAETSIGLTSSGELEAATATLRLSGGSITAPWEEKHPMQIDEGDLHIRYVKAEDRIDILPSTLEWGGSRATVTGVFRPVGPRNGDPREWKFEIAAHGAVLQAEEFGLSPLFMDEWRVEGTVVPHEGRLELTRYVMRAGDESFELSGTIVDAPSSPAIKLSGRLSAMRLSTLKQFWPKFVAGGAREWVGMRVAHGRIEGGSFAVDVGPDVLASLKKGGDIPDEAVRVEIGARDLAIGYIEDMPPLLAPSGEIRLAGRSFFVDVPQARIPVPSGQEIALTEGRFIIHDMRPDPSEGEIEFKANGSTQAVMELLDHQPLGYVQRVGLKPSQFSGETEGAYRIFLPLIKEVKFADARVRGSAQLTGLRAQNIFGETDVEDGTLNVSLSEYALEAQGELFVQGTPAQVSGQRIFSLPEEKQPPIRLSALLNAEARSKLGFDVNHIIRGDLPLTLLLGHDPDGDRSIRMQADLGGVELALANMGWVKKPGVPAQLEFQIDQHQDGSVDLRNFRILGNEIAIEGLIALDPDLNLRAFAFPDFSFNLQTHVAISGIKREDGVLEVSAKGPSYDGRQFFDTLFSAGEGGRPEKPENENLALDLDAEFDNVIGHYDSNLRDARIRIEKRGGQLVALDASGQLNGRTPVAVSLAREGNRRLLRAETKDAGSAFRLVGVYSKVEGGEASLEVDLDGGAPGEKTGTLWARNFAVLGDNVVGEVLSKPTPGGAQPAAQRQQRSRINFDQLRAPFRVGGGQLRLGDAYINGPLLGATMRGTIDFQRSQIDLGGTYVPLYGLNAAFSDIPLLGPLLSGRQGEGVFGITFAVQGSMNNPNVLVNPLSMVAPGFLRQIFEIGGGSMPPEDEAPTASTSNVPWQ